MSAPTLWTSQQTAASVSKAATIPSSRSRASASASLSWRSICESLALVAEAAVVVLDAPAPQLAAAVVPSATGAAILAEIGAYRFGRQLRRALAETQEPAGLPRRWRFMGTLPSGTLGKRRARDIASLFEEKKAARQPHRSVRPSPKSALFVRWLDRRGTRSLHFCRTLLVSRGTSRRCPSCRAWRRSTGR